MKMPQVTQQYFQIKGGLDLLTPAIQLDPGRFFDAQNYELEISGGAKRIKGHERYDGRPSPAAASYWVMVIVHTGSIAVSATVTGGTSAATGKVLGIYGTTLVLGRVSGTFVSGEVLKIGGVGIATAGVANVNGATSASSHNDYQLLAANDLRTDILVVPGSGRIRGVFVYNDITYAFRDNAGATAGDMYQSSAGGWVKINFGSEIQFTGAIAQIFAGNTITGLTSGATALVVRPMLRSGTWAAAGAGTLIISTITGTWQNGETIQVAAVNKATTASLATSITRLVGGLVNTDIYNFTGSTATKRVYGADGVNLAFEFDGTNYIPIRTGMTADTPSYVRGHKNYLFLSFLGSLQFSGLGQPYAWTAVLGAGEIATGDPITGMLPMGGNTAGSALVTYTAGKTYVLYGSSSANFQLTISTYDIGHSAFTMQPVGNNNFGLSNRGVQALLTTQNYGDFEYASVTHLVQPLMTTKRGLETCSTSSMTKNQYRLFFNDNTGIVIGLTGTEISGVMYLNYGKVVRCMTTATLSTGAEVTYFGSDDGYVYKDNTGTSFDGAAIESWVRLAYNHSKSPQVKKRYRRAMFEGVSSGYCSINITWDLDYADSDGLPSAMQVDQMLLGSGGFWDQFTWDQFTWDTKVVSNPVVQLDGTGKNISFLVYSNRAQDDSHTIQGMTLVFTPQRADRY